MENSKGMQGWKVKPWLKATKNAKENKPEQAEDGFV
jgi:hypothetical protein